MRAMKPCGSRAVGLYTGAALWLLYGLLQLRHFYNSAVLVPVMQRTQRNAQELRLPRIYFCPADRGRAEGFRWRSFECILTYKDDRATCPARIQGYRGRTPGAFSGQAEDAKGGECLEFGTHMIGVRQENSAAWNEITLRASFDPGRGGDVANALQEVELGYMATEWEVGQRAISTDRFYYPLLRVPIFFLIQGVRTSAPVLGSGVATRANLGKELERGRTHAGRYWYIYSAMQLTVENATVPVKSFIGQDTTVPGRVGVAHVIITLEDFEEYEYEAITAFYPFLGMLGQIAGVGALIWLALGRSRDRSSKVASHDTGNRFGEPADGGDHGFYIQHEKEEAASFIDEEGEEQEALLGADEPTRKQRKCGDNGGAGQSLLGEEGGDGL